MCPNGLKDTIKGSSLTLDPTTKRSGDEIMLTDKLPIVDFSRTMESIQRDFVFPGLPAGKVAVLCAPGGTGKSFLLLEIGMSVASGEALIHGIVPSAAGPVRYISFEEDTTDLHNRMCALFKTFKDFTPPVETFFPSALEGENLPLVGRKTEINGEAVQWLEKQCTGMRLVILDPLSRLHEADENSNSEMKVLMRVLIATAKKSRCSIVIAHHTSKASVMNGQGDQQQSSRGASCIVDDPRLTMTLSKKAKAQPKKKPPYLAYTTDSEENDSDRPLILTWAKMNGHKPIRPMELVRTETGILLCKNGVQGGVCYER